MKKSILLLENGLEFGGYVFGHNGTSIGEICFNTSMTGYQEVLTDPSYYGQIVTMTYPHIGNYGINNDDIESDTIKVSGMIVKEGSNCYSNYRGLQSISSYLIENKIVGNIAGDKLFVYGPKVDDFKVNNWPFRDCKDFIKTSRTDININI